MENLQQATEKICDLKGSQMATMAFIAALIDVLPPEAIAPLTAALDQQQAICENVLLNELVSEHVLEAFARDSALHREALAKRL